MLVVRQLWRALHGVPQLLLVQPEQLNYDLAYALALLPLVIAGILFFLQDALLLFAISFLAGIVCLLALQLARLTFGLPAWIGFRATHPLVASILIACFFPPRTPAWVAATMVILFVVIDTVIWPRLQRVMLHPALIVFGILFLIQRQLGFGYVNPFDGRHLDDPLTLWYKLQLVIDPVKLYVGNVSGPIGVTSAGAVLIGATYLWYTRKISLGIVTGFLCGIAALALVIRSDLGFQLASGPSLFLAGYIAADRRRVLIPERFTFAFGIAAGVATMILRWYGEGQQAAWQGLLLVSVVATIALRAQDLLRGRIRLPKRTAPLRTLTVESSDPPDPHRLWAPVRQEAPQPVMAMSPVATAYSRAANVRPVRSFDMQTDSDDLVRQMRRAATRGGPVRGGIRSPLAIGLALAIINPVGLVLTWTTRSLNRPTRLLLTGVSVIWYLAAAGLAFLLLTHR
ncbi:MAG: H+/Na+-translocating ferredoxin:NAD+ oxidoreductase subunit [Chloroflexota bacterium]|jgi:electron transport complex protein RnfD|nr:H+/Na+-translocating ferredoxin:NAD+ oxidoreductase subunit [Chloroflexota bacterium]MEA2668251.1 H+/Na+-translocating ferredoxin:NAD+ oxidoreductase subunit [Chloroflexota bacterium]